MNPTEQPENQKPTSKSKLIRYGIIAALIIAAFGITYKYTSNAKDKKATSSQQTTDDKGKPALAVELVAPAEQNWASSLSADGKIAAWQEASLGAQANGQQIVKVNVNIGDYVKKGQVLAVFSTATLNAELAQANANIESANATLEQARVNNERATHLKKSGAISDQQILQYTTAYKSAIAQLKASQAAANLSKTNIAQTTVIAPESGIISARTATVGSVAQAGQEMFRMVLQNRLEWRADLTAEQIGAVQSGAVASVTLPDGSTVKGRVRQVSPTLNEKTNSATVFVDLLENGTARAGMSAKGSFEMSASKAITLPQTAVVQRDGFYYVFTVDDKQRTKQIKVLVGRIEKDGIEITHGITAADKVVASGADFLKDGDLVRVVGAAVNTEAAKPAAAQ